MADKFYISTKDGVAVQSALVSGVGTSAAPPVPVAPRACVLGDQVPTELYFVDGVGGYDATITGTVRFAVSVPGLVPTEGTWTWQWGTQTSGTVTTGKRYKISTFVAGDVFTNIGAASNATGVVFTATGTTPTTWTNGSSVVEMTTDLAAEITSAALSTAVNLLASITAAGGVVVGGTAPSYIIEFNTVGARELGVGDGIRLLPDGQAWGSSVQTGTATVRSRQNVRLVRKPFVLQDTWPTIANGFGATVNYGTVGLSDYLGGRVSRADGLHMEVEVTDGSGNPRTYCSVPITARNEAVNPLSLVPVPYSSFLTEVEVLALMAAYAVGNLSSYEALTFSAAGNTDVAPDVGSNQHTALVTPSAGAGPYTRTVSLLPTNAATGSTIRVRVPMPASINPTVEVRNATSGGTLLLTIAPAATAFTVVADFVLSAGAWLINKTYYESLPYERINGNARELLDLSDATWRKLRSDEGSVALL